MIPLNATEAISPAIEHTKAFLQPFSLKLWLKLGLIALLAEAGSQFIFPPVGNPAATGTPSASGIGAASGGIGITSTMMAVFVAIAVIALVIGLALFYLSSRMQLVLMDMVATRTTLVAPVWNRTAPRTWRWIGFKVVVFLGVAVVFAMIFIVPLIYLFRTIPQNNSNPPTSAFTSSFVLIFIAAFLVFMIILLAIWSMRDFVLPFVLFEDATLRDALRRASALIRLEPGSVLFYLFMKFVLSLVAGIAAEICIFISFLIIGLPTGAIGATLWFFLHQSGSFGMAVMYISFGLLGLVCLVTFLGTIICICCALLIFYQAYALYFLGGRIPVIGNLLRPQSPMSPPGGLPLTPFLS
ncbi:MAG TPA: hypothetical protein VNU92_07675 [Edaphobacter sp.]|jgi:hypothetical protein|nr:hypothetical protein [Edaphobacter sp.]